MLTQTVNETQSERVFSIHFLWSESGWFQGRYPDGVSVPSWEEADRIVYAIARDHPGGGYMKTSFQIRLDDRVIYEGRYDIYPLSHQQENPNGRCDLKDAVRGALEFWTGTRCPAHMTPEKYEAIRGQWPKQVEAAKRWLADHGELLQ